jgi:hypothetical protein
MLRRTSEPASLEPPSEPSRPFGGHPEGALQREPHARVRAFVEQPPEQEGGEVERAVSLSQVLLPKNALLAVPSGTALEVVTGFVEAVNFPEPIDPKVVAARV